MVRSAICNSDVLKTGIPGVVIEPGKQMQDAADNPGFERAIVLRDQIRKLNERLAGKQGRVFVAYHFRKKNTPQSL
jgi:excinuclease UvrABC nuclease subunit